MRGGLDSTVPTLRLRLSDCPASGGLAGGPDISMVASVEVRARPTIDISGPNSRIQSLRLSLAIYYIDCVGGGSICSILSGECSGGGHGGRGLRGAYFGDRLRARSPVTSAATPPGPLDGDGLGGSRRIGRGGEARWSGRPPPVRCDGPARSRGDARRQAPGAAARAGSAVAPGPRYGRGVR